MRVQRLLTRIPYMLGQLVPSVSNSFNTATLLKGLALWCTTVRPNYTGTPMDWVLKDVNLLKIHVADRYCLDSCDVVTFIV